ncbi:MAG: Stp1/IreP family PP2C-type Ser/Thr phosphatase [Clostridia bacterium]|nr:Stp1/IreP family PP2C-type Ser/Thr phosphatase [Clostridia bacterium]
MEYAALTDVGMRRHNNEDSYIVNDLHENKIFIVADGMGGHNAGEIASLEACRIVESYILEHEGDIDSILTEGVVKANRDIFVRASENPSLQGMGTTIDVCVLKEGKLHIAHAGDGRVYLLTKDGITKLTYDHSIVGMMLDEGSITEEEAMVHPQRNYITRAVGSSVNIEVDSISADVHSGEWVLMCTDGLTNMVSSDTMHKIVTGAENVNAAACELVRRAKEQGGDDNITVVLLRV